MAGYTEFQATEPFISSLPKLLANDKSALTWNAGTSFPTVGLTAGMPCFRTDEQKLYVYDGTIWNVLIDLNDKPILNSTGKYVAYDRTQTLEETEKAQARSNIDVPSKQEFDDQTHVKADITDLKDVVGASASTAGVQGLVPQPSAGDNTKVLFGSGEWETAKVQVEPSEANAEQPIVLRSSTATTAGVDSTIIAPGVTVNPSTKTITAQKVIAQNFSGKIAWTDITSVPTNVKNAVSFVEGQTLTPEQAQIVRLKILTAYQTSNTGSLILPNGTIAQRDTSPVAGAVRFNSEKGWFEGYTGSQWVALVVDPAGKNLPTGTCICGLFKEAPDLFLSLDGSQIYLSDYYDLVNLLWEFETFRGDGSTYAVLPNMHHRFFEGTTTLSEVATYVEAGLPNITGDWNTYPADVSEAKGVFLDTKQITKACWQTASNQQGRVVVDFNAQNSNSLYCLNNSIQPLSIRSLVIVRI